MARKPGSSSRKSRNKPRRRFSKGHSRRSAPVSEANSIEIAVQHHQSGDLLKAGEIYRSVLNRDPNNFEALHLLGVISHQEGKNGIAVDLITKAISIMPGIAEAHFNLGVTLNELRRLDEAVASYRKAIDINPDFADAHNNLGSALQFLGKLDEAAASHRKALAINPGIADAHFNLGVVLNELGRSDEAVASYRKALGINPDFADAHNNLGSAFHFLGKLDEAIASFRKALSVKPDHEPALSNLASLCIQYGENEMALEYIDRLLGSKPEHLGAYVGKIRVLGDLLMADELAACMKRALEVAPDNEMLRLRVDMYCPIIMGTAVEVNRQRRDIEMALAKYEPGSITLRPDEIFRLGTELSFNIAYQGKNDLGIRSKYADLFRIDDFIEPEGSGEEVYRVGFFVTERHEGVFLNFMEGILKNISNERIDVFVVCTNASRQIISEKIGASKIRYHVILPNFGLALREIRAKRYDFLFYFEVGTDSFNYFLPFFRMAPVQCTSWGYPVTSGISQMDYFVSSGLLESVGAEDHYRERLERLSTLPVYYYRPMTPACPGNRSDFGIPEDAHLYLCAQSLFKIHPDFDKILGEILRADPLGQVMMIEGVHPNWRECLQARFRETIPDVAGRVQFTPRMSRDDYLRLVTMSNVVLDPFPFGSGNTAYESIAMGTPVVTLPGEFMRGRITSGCYLKIGVMDCVTSTPEEYVDIALKLGREADFRKIVQDKILKESGVLFEDDSAVRELEEFFIRAVEAARS